jgi:hypothetical protein
MKSKLIFILVILVIVAAATPIALASIHLRATYAAAPNTSQTGQGTRPRSYNSSIADWPEFGANVSRDGNQGSDTQLSKANANALVPVSGSAYFTVTGEAMSSPSIYQGILYYAANTTVTSGGTTQRVSTMYAVDTTNGQVLWSKPFPVCANITKSDYVFSTPAVTMGLVNGVATTEVFSGWGDVSRGCVYDFDGLTGNVIWTYATGLPTNSSPGIMSSKNGNIVVIGDNGNQVRAFSVNYNGTIGGHGKQLWRFTNANDPPPPNVAQYCQVPGESCGDAVFGSPAEGLVMVNGTPHHYIYIPVGSSFTNRAGRLDAIDIDTMVNGSPKLAWAFWDPNPSADNDFATATVLTDGNGFATRVFTGMHTGHMFGLDAVTGQLCFDFSTSAHVGNVQTFIHSTGALVTINGTTELIFGSGCNPSRDYKSCAGGNGGHVFAIDALSTASAGTELWQSSNYGGDIVSSPAVVNQGANAVVYIMGPWYPNNTVSRGDLLAFDPVNGNVLADYPIFNHAYGSVASPAVYGSHIFVTEGYSIYTWPPPPGGGLAAFQCTGC